MRKISLSIDIGVGSVGIAVADENLVPVRIKGKNGLFVRIFDEAQKADTRRAFRVAHRRIVRRRARLNLLNLLLSPAVMQKDVNFIRRLDYSQLHEDDKIACAPELKGKYTIFNGRDYTDKQYHRDYPTIYHLRRHLMNTPEKDIRLVYLGIHHIIKYRGNFLRPNFDFAGDDFADIVVRLNNAFCDESGEGGNIIPAELYDGVKRVLLCQDKDGKRLPKMSKSESPKRITSLIGTDGPKKEIAKTICGASFKCSAICELSEDSISFLSDTEERIEEVRSKLGDDEDKFIALKELYDWGALKRLLGSAASVSDAMIDRFDRHRADLALLKSLIKSTADNRLYHMMFDERVAGSADKFPTEIFPEIDIKADSATFGKQVAELIGKYKNLAYYSYVGREAYGDKRVGKDDFFKALKKKLQELSQNDAYADKCAAIIEKIDNGEFLPLPTDKDNSLLPYQLHKSELQKIISTQCKLHPIFNEKDKDGLSVGDKLLQLIEFRIPYYVGPLNDCVKGKDGKPPFAWVVRKEGMQDVRYPKPWEFDKVVDRDKSEDAFIMRMSSNCTYLPKEKALPRNSLLYSEYTVLNELNKIRVNGEFIRPDLKKDIFDRIFKCNKIVKASDIKRYYRENFGEEVIVEGLEKENGKFNAHFGIYIQLKSILGDKFDYPDEAEYSTAMIEEIIQRATVTEDKKRLGEWLGKNYGDKLSDTQIKRLCALTIKGWGRLSARLLNGITAPNKLTGEVDTVINALRAYDTADDSSYNLMELLAGRNCPWEFAKAVERENAEEIGADKLTYDAVVGDLACSPGVKRGIWQAVTMVDEIAGALSKSDKDYVIDKIYIEMPRSEEPDKKGKKTDTRKERLQYLYKAAKKDKKNAFDGETDKLSQSLDAIDNADIDDKLYLYYLQRGRCAYSDEEINLSNLCDYDIDHILPRCLIKDDSLDNKVLVKGVLNKRKGNSYTVPESMRQIELWNNLKTIGFMSKGKYDRLTRREYKSSDLSGFISRQLVETRQITRAVAGILKRLYPNARLCCPKAALASNVRRRMGWVKCRDINDFHHAHDAYLNMLCFDICERHGGIREGDEKKFVESRLKPLINIIDEEERQAKEAELKSDRAGIAADYVCHYLRNENSELRKIAESVLYSDAQFGKKYSNVTVTVKASESKGQFYTLQCYKYGKRDKLQPIKTLNKRFMTADGRCVLTDIQRYGGYTTAETAYFVLIECAEKNKTAKLILPWTRLREFGLKRYIEQLKSQHNAAVEIEKSTREYMARKFCEDGYTDVKVILPRIRYKASVNMGGFKGLLVGGQLLFHNANQLILGRKDERIIAKISGIMAQISKMDRFNRPSDEELSGRYKAKYDDNGKVISGISEEDVIKAFDVLVDKMRKPPYGNKEISVFNKIADKLEENRGKFSDASLVAKMRLIVNILLRMKRGANTLDVSVIGVKGDSIGKITMGANIGGRNMCIYEQSPCGLYSRELYRYPKK